MAVMPLERWSNPFAQTYLSFVQSTINAMSRLVTIESGFVTTKSGLYDLILPPEREGKLTQAADNAASNPGQAFETATALPDKMKLTLQLCRCVLTSGLQNVNNRLKLGSQEICHTQKNHNSSSKFSTPVSNLIKLRGP